MGTRENNAKIANLRNPRKFKPAKIRACTVSCENRPLTKEIFLQNAMPPSKSTQPHKNLLSVSL